MVGVTMSDAQGWVQNGWWAQQINEYWTYCEEYSIVLSVMQVQVV